MPSDSPKPPGPKPGSDEPHHDEATTPDGPARRRRDRAVPLAIGRGGHFDDEPTNRQVDRTAPVPRPDAPNSALTTLRLDEPPGVPPPRRPCLLLLAGPRLGELVPIEGQLVIGRDPGAGFQIIEEGISRRHVRITVEGDEVKLQDLDSTNGTWMEGQRVSMRVLHDGDRFRVGQTTVVKFAWQDALEERYQRQLLETALRDPLTAVFNGRYFRERLEAEVAWAERHRAPLSVLAVGVDRFELINRVHGRARGDLLLKRLAETIQGAVRTDDVVARVESDVFALLARDTPVEGGQRLADRLRNVIASGRFEVRGRPVELRVSIGVATLGPGLIRVPAALLDDARAALASAKDLGRNRIVHKTPAAGIPTTRDP